MRTRSGRDPATRPPNSKHQNMASSVYDDDSNHSLDGSNSWSSSLRFPRKTFYLKNETAENKWDPETDRNVNIIGKLTNRQLYGKASRNPKSKTEPFFNHIHHKCKLQLEELIFNTQTQSHIFMGFTLCGRYFISYKEIMVDVINLFPSVEYELYVWRFVLGKALSFVSKHRIFKLLKGTELDEIMFLQYPSDPYKLYCYGIGIHNPGMSYLSILTLPIQDNCRFCKANVRQIDDSLAQGWCLTHGFMLHYMFTMSQPIPPFDPHISLSFPDHIVINTGHYIHILNSSCYKPSASSIPTFPSIPRDEDSKQNNCTFTDNMSEVSESASDNFSANSIVEAILEDFSEYDLESNDCNKPFHELNISCEPLNVTGKSYHNTLVQNIVDPRLKRLQNKDYFFSMPQTSCSQKNADKPKIDRKIAEKAYEFTEENEKCEKLSSFRKKRLADKKYEFSEDNSENIVPFNSLRRERRYLYKPKGVKSPEFSSGLFLSPRSPGIRSPMQSPNSRNGQFSPAGRNIYCPGLRNSPHHSKSPISPRESVRKFNVYSPSMDSDCSDSDSKLVLRQIHNFNNSHANEHRTQPLGLLIVDSKKDESSKWIKKVVRRYSSVDFENSSLVSGQSRDDYNIPIEIPLIVQTLTDQHLDIVPEFKADQVTETQLIVTQRSFDCEQFVQIRAQRLCTEQQLEFLHCEDYDIKLLHICPLDGHIVCQAVIKIGALKLSDPNCKPKPHFYVSTCMFMWSIETDAFELIEPPEQYRLQLHTASTPLLQIDIPRIFTKQVLVMDINYDETKVNLRDYHNHYEVIMDYSENDYSNDTFDSLSLDS